MWPFFLLESNKSNQASNGQETERDQDKGHRDRLLTEIPKQVRTMDRQENRATEEIEKAVLEKAGRGEKRENVRERTQS